MIQVNIKDRLTKEQTNSAKFETLELANAWIDCEEYQERPWGRYLAERECPKTFEHNPLLVIEEFENEISPLTVETLYQRDAEGNLILDEQGLAIPTGETIDHPAVFETWVRLHPEYEIETLDITAEYEAELTAIEERRLEIQQIKLAIQLIKDSDKPAWEKKLLIRLVKELRD